MQNIPILKNNLHRFEIDNPNFVGDSIEINGNVILDYARVDQPLEAIRGNGLRIDLEATIDLDFSDLYSEEERTFNVTYIRNGQTIFVGYLLPDGLFQSFVDERWIVSFRLC